MCKSISKNNKRIHKKCNGGHKCNYTIVIPKNKSQIGLGSSYNNLILNYLDTPMFGKYQYIDNHICPQEIIAKHSNHLNNLDICQNMYTDWCESSLLRNTIRLQRIDYHNTFKIVNNMILDDLIISILVSQCRTETNYCSFQILPLDIIEIIMSNLKYFNVFINLKMIF